MKKFISAIACFIISHNICVAQKDNNIVIGAEYSTFTTTIYELMVFPLTERVYNKPLFEFFAGYRYNCFEVDAYYSINKIPIWTEVLPGLQNLHNVGIAVKYNVIPIFVKSEKITELINFSVKTKFGKFFKKNNHDEFDDPGMNYGLGANFSVFPVKRVGLFCEYEYLWFSKYKKHFDPDFFKFGVVVRI